MSNAPRQFEITGTKKVRRALLSGNMAALKLALSPRQRMFAEQYVYDFNATAAAIRAGYATTHAKKQAHLLATHPGIAAYIDHLSRTKEAKIAAIDPDYIIQQVLVIVNKDNARDGDRLRGLELLARHLGMFIDRTEITGKDGDPLFQKTEEDAKAFTELLKQLHERSTRDNSGKIDVELT